MATSAIGVFPRFAVTPDSNNTKGGQVTWMSAWSALFFFFFPTSFLNVNQINVPKVLCGSCPLSAPLPGDLLQPFLCVIIVGKAALVVAKGACVVIAPAINEPRRVLHMK